MSGLAGKTDASVGHQDVWKQLSPVIAKPLEWSRPPHQKRILDKVTD